MENRDLRLPFGELPTRPATVTVSVASLTSRRRYKPRRANDQDIALAAACREAAMTECELRVMSYYSAWVAANDATLWSVDSIFGFAGSIMAQLAPSTAVTYLQALRNLDNQRRALPSSAAIKATLKVAALRRAASRTEHARDIAMPMALAIIGRMTGREQLAVMTILVKGSRMCDLTRRCCRDVAVTSDPRSVTFDVLVAKNIRVAKNRRRINLRRMHLYVFPSRLWRVFAVGWSGPRNEKPLAACSSASVNAALRKAQAPYLALGERAFTTNSFRRNFIHRRIAEQTDPVSGLVDYAKVAAFTGHLDARTIEANYASDVQ